MQANLEQAKQIISQLPPEELEKFDEWFESEKQKKSNGDEKETRLDSELEKYKKARKWINENGEQYMNQWVCLDGDRLIASGTDGLEVHRRAKEAGIEAPFLHHIVDESLPFGGW
jgi:hypothetical protein